MLGPRRESWGSLVAELAPSASTPPLLVVHDENDEAVDVGQGRQIAAAHPGKTELLVTSGLGHNRILADPQVIERISSFVARPTPVRAARTRSTAS